MFTRLPLVLLRMVAILAVGAAFAAHGEAPDLSAPDLQAIRADYLAQRDALTKQRTEALQRLLDEQLASARQMAAKAKVSGNITAVAAGNTAVRLFTDARAAFDAGGAYAITNTVRRDLESMIDLFKANARVIEDRLAVSQRKLEATFAERLGAALAARKTPEESPEKRLALLAQLAGMVASNAAPAATNGPAAASSPTNAIAPVATSTALATSGTSGAWVELARLEIEVHDVVEIVSVSLEGVTASRTIDGTGAMGQPWQVVLTPLQELIPGDPAPPFRLQSVPPLKPLDVLSWPSSRNKWAIELRARSDALPSRHGVIIETDANAVRALAGSGGAAVAPKASGPPAKVGFDSKPAGATIFADGRPLVGDDRKALVTPCIALLPSGPTDLRFRKRGYQDAVLRQSQVASNIVFRVTLQPVPGFEERTVTIPSTGPEWTATGVRVKKGTSVHVAAAGQWACATGGELVDADGYPNNDRFYKYYLNPALSPRLARMANYGQLLARVPGGEPEAVGKDGAFAAAADGEVQLTINEPAAARRDNKGQLTVRVSVEP